MQMIKMKNLAEEVVAINIITTELFMVISGAQTVGFDLYELLCGVSTSELQRDMSEQLKEITWNYNLI